MVSDAPILLIVGASFLGLISETHLLHKERRRKLELEVRKKLSFIPAPLRTFSGPRYQRYVEGLNERSLFNLMVRILRKPHRSIFERELQKLSKSLTMAESEGLNFNDWKISVIGGVLELKEVNPEFALRFVNSFGRISEDYKSYQKHILITETLATDLFPRSQDVRTYILRFLDVLLAESKCGNQGQSILSSEIIFESYARSSKRSLALVIALLGEYIAKVQAGFSVDQNTLRLTASLVLKKLYPNVGFEELRAKECELLATCSLFQSECQNLN